MVVMVDVVTACRASTSATGLAEAMESKIEQSVKTMTMCEIIAEGIDEWDTLRSAICGQCFSLETVLVNVMCEGSRCVERTQAGGSGQCACVPRCRGIYP